MMLNIARRVNYLLLAAICTAGPAPAQQRGAEAPRPAQERQTPPATEEEAPQPGIADPGKPLPAVTPGVAAPVDPKAYLIGPGDVLLVRVWREPELTGQHQVRPDGRITLPLIGEVQAGGITPEQLTTSIVGGLEKFINKPEVMVSVQQVLSKKYYITGEVGRTGTFPLVVPTTVLEAISNAGGFREFANKKNVIIMRGTERLKFNYNAVIKGKNLEQNIYLKDGDHIIVQD